jgi:hypothetical protein
MILGHSPYPRALPLKQGQIAKRHDGEAFRYLVRVELFVF